MEQDKYEEYAILDSRIKQLTEKKDALKKELLEEVLKAPDSKIRKDYGLFSTGTTRKWKFSEDVDKMAMDLEILKENEKENNTAKLEETKYLTFKAKK